MCNHSFLAVCRARLDLYAFKKIKNKKEGEKEEKSNQTWVYGFLNTAQTPVLEMEVGILILISVSSVETDPSHSVD